MWPYDGQCDLPGLQRTGWRPTPLNEFIFKVETRCNLNCEYCYVYNLGDESWHDQPAWMADAVVEAAAERIRAHALAHALPGVLISLHGGEPLLRGVRPVTAFLKTVRRRLAPVAAAFSMQTNATLIDERVAAELAELDVGVGVSIDGDFWANRRRLDVHGRSSFERCVNGIQCLRAHDGLLQGALCVIDLDNDPVSVFGTIVDLGFTSVDFLLPHGSWVQRPAGKGEPKEAGTSAAAPYADWLLRIFDVWTQQKQPLRVRIFDDVIHLLLGGTFSFESLGLAPSQLVVIEADGSIELVDHIGISYEGAERTGLSVFSNSLDDALAHPGVVCRQIGEAALCASCRVCDQRAVCGGGLITHRFDVEGAFRNPSVYCSDLYRLIAAIRVELSARIAALLPSSHAG